MFKKNYFILLFWIGMTMLSLSFSSCQTKKSEISQNSESDRIKNSLKDKFNDEITLDNSPTQEIDLENDKQNFEAFMKIRSSVEGLDSTNQAKESTYYWEGSIYSFVEGERSKKIMGMKGFSMSRWVKTDSSRQLLTREVALYTDKKTGAILEKMKNPFLGENADSLEVIHVWNDPVNQKFPYIIKQNSTENIIYGIPYTQLGEDMICFYADIFLTYPSIITRKEFPQNVQSDLYQGAELFQFFVRKNDLENPMLNDIPATISWTRIGQWLPFMNMGDRKGNLVYQCRGYKVLEGFEGLPQDVKEYVRAKQPIFEHAPTEYSEPNETSWSYFKKVRGN